MNKGVLFTLTAISFGGIGGLAGYLIARKKFFDLADREVESIKAKQAEHDKYLLGLYGIKLDVNDEKPPLPTSTATVTPNTVKPSADRLEKEKAAREDKAAFVDYSKIANNYSKPEGGSQRSNTPVSNNSDIYVITPDEFNESDYSYQTLLYYPDGHVSDNDGNLVSNFVELIGNIDLWCGYFDNLDAVYVRNDRTGTDYEILRQSNAWTDIASPDQKAASLNVSGKNEDDD